jgi:hypothetical protein
LRLWQRIIPKTEFRGGVAERFVGVRFQVRLACSRSAGSLSPLHPCVTDHRGSSALADILVSCPRTGAPVSTGLKTEWVVLKSLPSVAVPLSCPACGQMHKWKPDDAWIGSARQSGDGSFAPASRAPLLMASSNDAAKLPDCD